MRASPVISCCAAVLAALGLPSATPAVASGAALEPQPVTACGSTLPQLSYLTADLVCPDGVGVVLPDGGDLDLRGHRLAGPGTGAGVSFASGSGTVRDGRIEGWATGVDQVSEEVMSSLVVRGVHFAGNERAVAAYQSRLAVADSRFVGNGTAVQGFASEVRVTRTVVTDNEVGVSVAPSFGATVTLSRFERNETALGCSEAYLDVRRSVVRSNATGIATYFCAGDVAAYNVFSRNKVAFSSSRELLDPETQPPDVLSSNRFVDNDLALDLGVSSSVRLNTLLRNDVAVRTAPDVASVLFHRNVVSRNGEGLRVLTPAGFRGNVAVRNGGYGIYAPRATDLGGNVAYGNARRPQCVGVVCRPRR